MHAREHTTARIAHSHTRRTGHYYMHLGRSLRSPHSGAKTCMPRAPQRSGCSTCRTQLRRRGRGSRERETGLGQSLGQASAHVTLEREPRA